MGLTIYLFPEPLQPKQFIDGKTLEVQWSQKSLQAGRGCNCMPLWYVLCNKIFERRRNKSYSAGTKRTSKPEKHYMIHNAFNWCWLSEVDWVALCCRQLCEWVLMSWEMKRAAREMTAASRIHRLDSLLLLSALFTLHTWAGIQINLRWCHRMLNIRDEYFIFSAADWGAFARSKISNSPERDISSVCPSLYCIVSTSRWLKCTRQ